MRTSQRLSTQPTGRPEHGELNIFYKCNNKSFLVEVKVSLYRVHSRFTGSACADTTQPAITVSAVHLCSMTGRGRQPTASWVHRTDARVSDGAGKSDADGAHGACLENGWRSHKSRSTFVTPPHDREQSCSIFLPQLLEMF